MVNPKKIFLQRSEERSLGREESKVMAYAIMENIPYQFFSHKDLFAGNIELDKDLLVVGSVESFREAIRQLTGLVLDVDCLPHCLHNFLERDVWLGTKSDVLFEMIQGREVFAKPLKTKLFTGQLFSESQGFSILEELSSEEKLYLSEVVTWTSEFRAYVRNGEIVAICQYAGEEDDSPDESVIRNAVDNYQKESPKHKNFTLDFGITRDRRTTFIELNDGWAIGAYKGISDQDYFGLLWSRWKELTEHLDGI